jgi:CBS domain-containing protein
MGATVKDVMTVTAADLMTTPPVTITPGEPVAGAARLVYPPHLPGRDVIS